MTKEEYNKKKTAIDTRHQLERNALMKEFAFSNNPVKIGDIITDHMESIKVEAIGVTNGRMYPSCTYIGLRYTKTGKPFKRGGKCNSWQADIKKINGKDITDA